MTENPLNWYCRELVWFTSHYFVDGSHVGSKSLCGDRIFHVDCSRFPSSGGTFKKCAECRARLERTGTPSGG